MGLGFQDLVLPHTKLGLSRLQLISGGAGLPLGLSVLPGSFGGLLPEGDGLSAQPLQLVGAAQDTGAAVCRAAGHGTAGVEDLTVQSDDPELIAVLPGGGNAAVQIFHDGHPPQQVGKDMFIFGIEGDQLVAHTHEAPVAPEAVCLPQLPGPDGADGQDGCPAGIPALEVADDGLAVLLGVHHQILHGAAQRRLNGDGILVGHLQQSGHGAVDVVQSTALSLVHDQLDGLGVALVLLLHFGEHPDARGEGILLHLQLHLALFGLFRLFSAAVHTQGVTLNDIFGGVPLLLGLGDGLAGGPGFLFCGVGAVGQLPDLTAHRLVPV